MDPDSFDSMTGRGYKIWFYHPERTPVDLNEIKHASTNICRFNGHFTWKLIQHLALCTMLAEYHTENGYVPYKTGAGPNGPLTTTIISDSASYLIAQCAAHDFHEIYVGDVITGLKKYLNEYKVIEKLWETWVLKNFDLDYPEGNTKWFVKYIDLRALTLEMIGNGHMKANTVIELYGQPDEHELRIYEQISKSTPDQCWNIITKAIEKYREELWQKEKSAIQLA